jgi:hypothetical protein
LQVGELSSTAFADEPGASEIPMRLARHDHGR